MIKPLKGFLWYCWSYYRHIPLNMNHNDEITFPALYAPFELQAKTGLLPGWYGGWRMWLPLVWYGFCNEYLLFAMLAPMLFPDCISTCPVYWSLIFKDSSILHECKWLLIYQRQHCLSSVQLSEYLLCLCPLITPTTLALWTWAVFPTKSISCHRRAHNSELRRPVCIANRNRFSHCLFPRLLLVMHQLLLVIADQL